MAGRKIWHPVEEILRAHHILQQLRVQLVRHMEPKRGPDRDAWMHADVAVQEADEALRKAMDAFWKAIETDSDAWNDKTDKTRIRAALDAKARESFRQAR